MHDCRVHYYLGAALSLMLFLAGTGCAHGRQTPTQILYVAIPETATVALFPVAAEADTRPIAVLKEPPSDKPVDVSADLLGDVFVANENGNVRAYGGRNLHYELIRTVEGPHTRIQHPTALTVDIAGSFYVAEAGDAPAQARVEWFAAGLNGNVTPNRTINGPHTGITSPRGLAIDASGRLYVADRDSNKVLIFDADAKEDAAPFATLTGLHSPERISVDPELNIYVTNKGDNTIAVFTLTGPQSWTPAATISSAVLRNPGGIAADAAGRIAVAATGGVLFFAPNANGATQPLVNLRGNTPMNPMGIFIR
jgi:DNA-binding beta-propeller fold protein YncE